MRTSFLAALLALLALTLGGHAPAQQEPAAAPSGAISGRITNPEKCLGVQVLARIDPDPGRANVRPARYDAKTGEFSIANLPDGVYHLRLLIEGGQVDGFDARFPPLPPTMIVPPFTAEDEAGIREYVANLPPAFVDTNRVVMIIGRGNDAKVLGETIRCRPHYESKEGYPIWRIEVWTFEKQTGVWVRVDVRPVLARVQVRDAASDERFDKLTWLFIPEAGGLEIVRGKPIEGLEITVPKPDMAFGKVPGSVRKQVEAFRKQEAEKPPQD